MRLLAYNNDGEFSLTQFFGDDIPEYAILSHTWGAEEVTMADLTDGTGMKMAGYGKIQFCGAQARRDGLQYFWVDTCCIDKANSAELVEAINSMFRWYRNAAKCYVYLSDVSTNDHDQVDPSLQLWQSAFRDSRWFRRGWTLQELIAPRSVEFFCSNGKRLGDKKSLERQLHEITQIAVPALQGTSVSEFSEGDRMSWTANRQTKHAEDRAYSLLGIFDISMPVIYGEGAEKAFGRLREEIYKNSKKRKLGELSSVSHTFNSTKRFKTRQSESSSIPFDGNPHFFDPELPCSEHSVYVNNSPQTRKELVTGIDATTKQSLIDQLYFTKIDERLSSLTAAQGTTCRWFLTKPEYASWHDVAQQTDHGGFMWIQGNPGTGKSTLMKLLFEVTKLKAKDDPSQITVSFFFLARGIAEEKSTTGLYRSLLHQLLQKEAELTDSLEWMTADGARAIQRNGWHEEALKQTLTHTIKKLKSRPLTIFIDALDECDDNQAAGMVGFFEELCHIAREAQVRLKICFSSRHYPTIDIQKGIKVTLEDEIGHTEDMKQYIKSKLKVGKMKKLETLQSDTLKKSSGIFLWVVLVVDILNSEHRNGSSATKIRDRLEKFPPKLNDLFKMIIERDGENLDQLHICLKWILFATRPLKPPELYFAVQISLDKECSGFWDQDDIDLDQMKMFVRSSSKGLADVTRNKASEVQFIHESVRDFLLGKYEGEWSGTSDNFLGDCHEILRNCCLVQLGASINENIDIPDPLPQASQAAQLRETIHLKFPFLEYSTLNVLRHANSAQQNAIEQGDFLADFPFQRWIFLNNALERYDIRRYTESASMLYILAEKDLAHLIRIHPQRKSCFDVEYARYGLPIIAALAAGSQEAVQTLLEAQAEIQPYEPEPGHLCKQYSEKEKKKNNLGCRFPFSRKRSVFSNIAELDDDLILAFFCASGKLDVKEKDTTSGCTPLSWAAQGGHVESVKLLLEKDADLEAKDNYGGTPLSHAAGSGREAVVKLLLEKDADLESKDNDGHTPLSTAACHGCEAVVKLLLEKDADLESKDRYGKTPLLWAAYHSREVVVKLLLEKDADLESKDNYGGTPLSHAAGSGCEVVVKLLLEKDADLESKDNDGHTPLSWAAYYGREAVVKLLLKKDADLESKDKFGRTPLSWAAEKGDEAIVKILLETGKADVDSKDENGRTPLSWAVERGGKAIIKTLLDIGMADVDSKDENGRTPLSWAAEKGDEAIIKTLLDIGKADVDSKDENGRTPLWWAAKKGREIEVKILLGKSAEESQSFDCYHESNA